MVSWQMILQVRTEIFILVTQVFSTRAAQEDSRQAGRMYSNSSFSQRRMVKGEAISTAVQCRKLLIRWKYWCEDQNMWMIPSDIKPWCSEVFPSPQAASSRYFKRDYSFRGMFLCFNVLHEVDICSPQVSHTTSQSGVCKCWEHKPGLHAMMWEFSAVAQTVRHGSIQQISASASHTNALKATSKNASAQCNIPHSQRSSSILILLSYTT